MPAERSRMVQSPTTGKSRSNCFPYHWAPLAGAILGFSLTRGTLLVPLQPKADALLNPHVFHALAYTFFGFIGGLTLWLLSTSYFNDKHTQFHPNRTWHIVPALLFMLVPFVGLLLAFWAKRGNRLPGLPKTLADVCLMVSLTMVFIVILIVVVVNALPQRPLA